MSSSRLSGPGASTCCRSCLVTLLQPLQASLTPLERHETGSAAGILATCWSTLGGRRRGKDSFPLISTRRQASLHLLHAVAGMWALLTIAVSTASHEFAKLQAAAAILAFRIALTDAVTGVGAIWSRAVRAACVIAPEGLSLTAALAKLWHRLCCLLTPREERFPSLQASRVGTSFSKLLSAVAWRGPAPSHFCVAPQTSLSRDRRINPIFGFVRLDALQILPAEVGFCFFKTSRASAISSESSLSR